MATGPSGGAAVPAAASGSRPMSPTLERHRLLACCGWGGALRRKAPKIQKSLEKSA